MTDEEWDDPIEPPLPFDPHDTLADPERHARVSTRVNEQERRERHADDALSDFGSGALHRRWSRHDEE